MKAIVVLVVSLLVLGLTLAWNFFVADFMGDFGGPDNLPPAGFRRVLLDGAIKAAPVYAGAIIAAVVSGVAVFRNRKQRRDTDNHSTAPD